MSDFKPFAQAVHDQFTFLSEHELFVVDIDADELYAAYLAAFPPGTNEIFRERTEHDCSTCRNFIKNLGPVVAIVDGAVHTVWDRSEIPMGLAPEYEAVSDALANLVRSKPIKQLFRTNMPTYGAEKNAELGADGTTRTWHHFHGKVAAKHFTQTPGAAVGEHTGAVQVFRRGLEELKPSAVETVLELIDANALYRGAEFRGAVAGFQVMQLDYQARAHRPEAEREKEVFVLANAMAPAARIRNTAIGTLLQDLSEGVELERAVKSFEDKVSGTSYKRPTALITPRMIEDAMKTIEAEGLEPALDRRLANIGDITINNVVWADNSVKPAMKGGLHGLLLEAAAPTAVIEGAKAEDISIADFLATVLPKAHSLGLLVKNAHQGNFMTLTAPKHADVKPLFKWDNNFAWSYDGNITDSIKERVKAAGGNVTGDLCCRLAWEYTDDLDFHMQEPDGGHIYFSNRGRVSGNGGMLDVDANGMDGQRPDPAENIFYESRKKMRDGVYELKVNNYNRRSTGVGFEVEIEFDGQRHHIVYDKVLADNKTITVAKIQKKGDTFTIIDSLAATAGAAKGSEKWGVTTETLVKVNTVLKSPNHWDGQAVGNEHVFFILDGCKTDVPARGIYNEFLRPDLEKHRKVFEVLGNKTMCEQADDQLSGLGFSTTKRDSVLISVTGEKIRKTYNVQF